MGRGGIGLPPRLKRSIRTANQRATYRVAANAGSETQLWVGLRAGPVLAELDDVSSRGCGFWLTEEQAAELSEGSQLVIRILIGGPTMPQLFIKGSVRGLRPVDGRVRVGVAFDDPERLYTQLQEPQWRYFNRRGAFRVPPADERGRPLRARFQVPGQEEVRSFALHDLSSSGLSISLRPPNDATFPKHIPVSVEFLLPGALAPTELWVMFVHRTVIDGRTRIGFRIDEQRTEDCEETCEQILRYVLERQQQLLSKGLL